VSSHTRLWFACAGPRAAKATIRELAANGTTGRRLVVTADRECAAAHRLQRVVTGNRWLRGSMCVYLSVGCSD